MFDVQKTLLVKRFVTKSHRNGSCLPVFRYDVCKTENGSILEFLHIKTMLAQLQLLVKPESMQFWKILSSTIRKADTGKLQYL